MLLNRYCKVFVINCQRILVSYLQFITLIHDYTDRGIIFFVKISSVF